MISYKKTNQFKECKLYHDSGILTTENSTFSEEHDIVCTSSKQKNDCYYKEAKIKLDIDALIKVKNTDLNNPIIGYLNFNTLQNKVISLREIIAKTPLDVFCVDETKLDDSFPLPLGSKLKRRRKVGLHKTWNHCYKIRKS